MNLSKSQSEGKQGLVVFLSGIPEHSTPEIISSYFAKFGEVAKVNLKIVGSDSVCFGYGYLECSTEEMVLRVLNHPDHYVMDRRIRVELNEQGKTLQSFKKNLVRRKAFLIGVPTYFTNELLYSYFAEEFDVERAFISQAKESSKRAPNDRCYGVLIMGSIEECERLLALKRYKCGRHKIACRRLKDPSMVQASKPITERSNNLKRQQTAFKQNPSNLSEGKILNSSGKINIDLYRPNDVVLEEVPIIISNKSNEQRVSEFYIRLDIVEERFIASKSHTTQKACLNHNSGNLVLNQAPSNTTMFGRSPVNYCIDIRR